MRDFVRPQRVQPEVNETFRQMQLLLKRLDTPLLTNRSSLQGIAEGQSAYFMDGNTIFRYTKINGKLLKENVDEGFDEERVIEITETEIAAIPRAPQTALIDRIEVSVPDSAVATTTFDLGFDYDIGKNPTGKEFRVRWFPSLRAKVNEGPEADPQHAPIAVEWIPPTPVQEEGEHSGILVYRLQTTGNFIGHIDIVDVE